MYFSEKLLRSLPWPRVPPYVLWGTEPHAEDYGSGLVEHCAPRQISTPLASAPWRDRQASQKAAAFDYLWRL